LPLFTRVQAEECVTSHTVASGVLVDTILNGLNDRPGLRLNLASFTRKLDLVEGDKSVTNASRSTKVVEGVFKLCEPELLLSVDDAT
jgi:hypothetical protein